MQSNIRLSCIQRRITDNARRQHPLLLLAGPVRACSPEGERGSAPSPFTAQLGRGSAQPDVVHTVHNAATVAPRGSARGNTTHEHRSRAHTIELNTRSMPPSPEARSPFRPLHRCMHARRRTRTLARCIRSRRASIELVLRLLEPCPSDPVCLLRLVWTSQLDSLAPSAQPSRVPILRSGS